MALRFPFRLAVAAALGLGTVASAADPIKSATATFHADQQLADAIAGKLAQSPTLSGYQVDVTCAGGSVELAGSVRNEQQREEVRKIVRGISGVKKIKDQMVIRKEAEAAPAVEPAQALEPMTPPAFTSGPATGFAQGGPPMHSSGPIAGFQSGGPPASFSGPMGSLPVQSSPPQGGMVFQGGPIPQGAAPGGYGMDPTPMNVPPTGGLYDSSAPKMPPYAWPTYAPYNNYSRVGYPTEYPQNAFPFIGPFYPFPKVPLGYRAIKLEWEDGHWYYGRNGTMRDMWKVRYW